MNEIINLVFQEKLKKCESEIEDANNHIRVNEKLIKNYTETIKRLESKIIVMESIIKAIKIYKEEARNG